MWGTKISKNGSLGSKIKITYFEGNEKLFKPYYYRKRPYMAVWLEAKLGGGHRWVNELNGLFENI